MAVLDEAIQNMWSKWSGFAKRAGGGAGGGLRGRQGEKQRRMLMRVVEIALAIVLGLILIRIAFLLLAPLPKLDELPLVESQEQATLATLAYADPFRVVGASDVSTSSGAAALEDTTLKLTLHGVWVEGDNGTAIIGTPDGQQSVYSVGDTIVQNAKLESVLEDRVIISRAGVREALRFPMSEARDETIRRFSTQRRPAAVELLDVIAFAGIRAEDGQMKIELRAASDEAAFQAFGLRAGDILVSVENQPIPVGEEALRKMLEQYSTKSTITIVVERDDLKLPVVLALTRTGFRGE